MKQELAPRGVGIPGLQAGEDVKWNQARQQPATVADVPKKKPAKT